MSHQKASERFEALVAQYGHVIRSAIRSVLGHSGSDLGADAEQQVLLELWKQVTREQEITYPSSYLYKAAVRETIRLARQARRRNAEDVESLPIADRNPDRQPERRAESHELSDQLRRTTAGLQPDRRTAVIAHLAGFDVREIMASNDWSYNRARNLIARGMADLRKALMQSTRPERRNTT